RHPPGLGGGLERLAGGAPGFWERIKGAEKGGAAAGGPAGVLSDVPLGLPALTRAVKLQHKAAAVGFDWPSLKPVFDKLKEELGELEAAIADAGAAAPRRKAALEEEFGDLMFVIASVARHLGLEPETVRRRPAATCTPRVAR